MFLTAAERTSQEWHTSRSEESAAGSLPGPDGRERSKRFDRMDIPTSRPWPDDFYRQEADLYRRPVGFVRTPAGVIADANGVPVKRVHKWVKLARDRKFLPPGRQGKAG
jgi:hypothetical protein